MVNYNNGQIYKIEDLVGEMFYIGSTTKSRLCQRMVEHRAAYERWKAGKCGKVTSFDIFEKYGIKNCRIVLIENYPCESKDELTSREAHYIRTVVCVNKAIPGRTDEQYYQDNKEKIIAQKSERVDCRCGKPYTRGHIKRHAKSKRHIDYIANNPEI